MPELSIVEEMKDKASRVIPTPYSGLAEEATSETLLSADFDKISFMCDSANAKEENTVDVVRAVRRRIDHKSPKVQIFTLALLEHLVKGCGETVHFELAECKGLLRDLVAIATRVPTREGELEARTTSLALILNLSVWFAGFGGPRCRPLVQLADEVRRKLGEKAFEGIHLETGVTLRRQVTSTRRAASARQAVSREEEFRQRQQREYLRIQRDSMMRRTQQQPRIVAAIPVVQPTEESISDQLDACLLLAECLNNTTGSIIGDETIAGIGTQIRKDNRHLTMLLESGAELANMEMLLSVADSQAAVLQRLAEMVEAQGRQLSEVAEAPGSQNFVPPVGSSSGLTTLAQPQRQPPSSLPQRQPSPQPQPEPQPQPQPVVTTPAAAVPTQPVDKQTTAAPAPKSSVLNHTTNSGASRRGPRAAADTEEEMTERSAQPVPNMDAIFSNALSVSAELAPPAVKTPPAAKTPPPQPQKAPPQKVNAPQASLNADNDDFDEFLNERMQKQQ